MRMLNLIKIAYRSLNRNKFRSFLTMLGIIIGVASVIAMLAIGQGSKKNIQDSVESLGSNTIILIPGAISQGGVHLEAGSANSLKRQDAEAIMARCQLVQYVSPVVYKGAQVVVGSQNWRTVVYGVLNDYFKIRTLAITDGISFSTIDERAAAKVCIIGQTVRNKLFGMYENPLGQVIRINAIPFKVIGVLDKKGQNSFGQDQDDVIIAPFSTVQKRMLSNTNVNNIMVSAVSQESIVDATDEITRLIRERHKLAPFEEDDFIVRSQQDIANIFGAVSKVLTILLASIASISLLVGGIGIMNIMLVSVTERTREIGIRLAVGAKSRDILFQFMIESVFMSFMGGLIGIVAGIFVSVMVAKIGGWPVDVTPFSILLSFGFSSFVGLFFGWYPAKKASKLNPIEALRYE